MKIYKILAALIAAFATLPMLAQNVNTPYSMYGYGIIGDRATSMQRQMGGVGYAMNSGRQINVMNPASYAAIDSLTFLFDMGADVSLLHSKEGSAKENSVGGGLDYLLMQFPVTKYMGMSIGMLPYTSVGYAFGSDIAHGTRSNQGRGGINMAYLGWSGRYAGVSIGFNVSYNFGNIINDVYTTPQTGNSLFEHIMEIRDWDITVGAQYTANIDRFNKVVVGATFSPKKSLHGNSRATIQDLSFDSRPDTVGNLPLKGNYYTPMSIGAGISYTRERTSRLMIEADFTYQEWSKAKYSAMYATNDPETLLFQGMKFNNRYKGALGAEFIPKLRGNYPQRMAYRLGGYYTQDYLNIFGNKVNEYGITCGFGLPTAEGKTVINVGFEWKHRVASPQQLICENYFNFTVGVNFNELWFWQRRIR